MSDDESGSTTHQSERTTIRPGRNFEAEFRLDADDLGAFLVELGEQLQTADQVTLETDAWELPFAFGDPIDLEVEYDGVGQPELELEIELPGRTDDRPPTVR